VNERLRTTLLRAGVRVEDLAACVGINPKSVERWIYRSLLDVEGCEVRLHGTTLYASLFRYHGEILVNPHAYVEASSANPVPYLRRLNGAGQFDHYVASLNRVWNTALPRTGEL